MNSKNEIRVGVIGPFAVGKNSFIEKFAGVQLFTGILPERAITFHIHLSKTATEQKFFIRHGDMYPEISRDVVVNILQATPSCQFLEKITDVEIEAPAPAGLENICLVKIPDFLSDNLNSFELENLDRLILIDSATTPFNLSFVDEIKLLYMLNPTLVKNALTVINHWDIITRGANPTELENIKASLVKRAAECCHNPAVCCYFVSSYNNSTEDVFAEIRAELGRKKIQRDTKIRTESVAPDVKGKNFIDAAFEILPPIIDSTSEKASYRGKLQALQKRYQDPEFRLAIVGNFNSGKSTFLNALVGCELLSTATLPTTAIPTYIRWNKNSLVKKQHDARKYYTPIVTITMSDGRSYVMMKKGRANFAHDFGIVLPSAAGEMIDFLTTTNDLVGKVQRVDLSFIERGGFENFCMIDTPGVNPGEEKNLVHIQQTQNVLRDKADAMIILYQAVQAMTHDTQKFMEENASHLLQGAIVVLTYMDLLHTPQDCEKVLRNTEKLVRKKFKQENPRVYGISAFKALEYSSGRSQSAEDKIWAQGFNETVSEIIQQLGERRAAIISQRISTLIVEMVEALTQVISSETAKLAEESEMLKKAAIGNLEREFLELNAEYQQNINRGSKSRMDLARGIVRSVLADWRVAILSQINDAGNATELKACIEEYYPVALNNAEVEITRGLKKKILPEINDAAAKYAKKVSACLEKYESYLGDIQIKKVQLSGNLTANISGEPATFVEDSFFENNTALILSGAAAILTGVGLIVLIGGWIIDAYLFRKKKDEVKASVEQKLDEYEHQLIYTCEENLRRIENENLHWAQNLLENYKANYREAFDQKERDHKRRTAEVEEKIAQNKKNIALLQALRDERGTIHGRN